MTSLVVYPLVCVAAYYLASWALITSWLWRHYPPRLDQFLRCAACAGFWYGLGAALIGGLALDLPFLGLPGDAWYTPPLVGLCSIVWTPLLGWWHLSALLNIGGLSEASAEARKVAEALQPAEPQEGSAPPT